MNTPTPKPHLSSSSFQVEMKDFTVSVNTDWTTLRISVFKDTDFPRKRFEAKFDYDELLKKSKWFRLFDLISDIASEVVLLLKEGKFKLQEEPEKISLYLLTQFRQVDNIVLEIPIVEVENNNLIEDICSMLAKMKKSLEKMDKTFEVLSKSSQFQRMIERAQRSIQNKGFLSESIMDLVTPSISPTKKVDFALLYVASLDGDSSKSFHSHCDLKGSTLVIVEIENGLVIGGYNSMP